MLGAAPELSCLSSLLVQANLPTTVRSTVSGWGQWSHPRILQIHSLTCPLSQATKRHVDHTAHHRSSDFVMFSSLPRAGSNFTSPVGLRHLPGRLPGVWPSTTRRTHPGPSSKISGESKIGENLVGLAGIAPSQEKPW